MKHLLLALPLFVMACSSADGGAAQGDIGDPSTSQTTPGGDSTPPAVSPEQDGGASKPEAAPPEPEPELVLAKDLAIDEIAIFQGVKVELEKAGVANEDKKVHVVAGREGLLRVYVTPGAGWTAREVIAELTLQVDGKPAKVLTATKTVSAASQDSTLDSTINIDIPKDTLEVGAKYQVRLLTKPGQTGSTKGARFPEGEGMSPMDVWDTGESLKVVLVPIKANGYVPDISDAQIERYRKQLQAMYPVRKIDLKVHAVYSYGGVLGARGVGISGALDAITTLRKTDGVDKDVYYYGVFAPTSSFSTYCIGSCTTGLCHLPGPSDTFLRACVGVGFTGSSSAGTMAHELGHAHGIPHAPCGSVAGADSKYPYAGGKIGAWGYDERTQTLISPTKNYDFMSYCDPAWISDYAFDRIIHRMDYVRKEAAVAFGVSQTYQFVHVLADGTLEWGSDIDLDEPMFGEPHEVTVSNADGSQSKITGYFYPYGEEGGSLLVPKKTGSKLGTLTVAGFGVERHLPR